MAIFRYCWRCKMDIPMLEDSEWDEIYPFLKADKKIIAEMSGQRGISIAELLKEYITPACNKYFEITGFKETNPNAIWHHRNSNLGQDCSNCGKPFRTKSAKWCAACWVIKNTI